MEVSQDKINHHIKLLDMGYTATDIAKLRNVSRQATHQFISKHIAKKQVWHTCRENIYLKEIEFDGAHNTHKGTCSICGEFIGWFKIDPPKQNT